MYTRQRDAGLPHGPTAVEAAKHVQGKYVLEITPTFSIEKDPFALQSDKDDASLLELKLNGRRLGVPDVGMLRGQVIRVRELTELQVGFNEFYISASPPMAENMIEHGIRVKLVNNNKVLLDKTIWANRGALVSGSLDFTLAAQEEDLP